VLRRRSLAAFVPAVAVLALAVLAAHAALRLQAARSLWAGQPAPVLIYHDILPEAQAAALAHDPDVMSVARFAAQMDVLAAAGYHPVHVAAFASGRPLPPRSVLITFDDGYASTLRYAYPILARHGFPATVFLITDRVGQPGYLTWADVRRMRGLIDFGGHTAALHYRIGRTPALEAVPAAVALADLRRCRAAIAEHVGRPPLAFAYPFGAVTAGTAAIVREAGFSVAFAGQRRPAAGVPPRYAYPRFPVPPRLPPTEFRLFALGDSAGASAWVGLMRETLRHAWADLLRRL
jgi:peptidoglycan/xylan/chitin deacetylase (PgdA/CDA1 family)